MRAVVVLLVLAITVGGCTSDKPVHRTYRIADVIAKWPSRVDTLVPVRDADLPELQAVFTGSTDVAVRHLQRHGRTLARELGIEVATVVDSDVLFVSRPGGYRAGDARTFWHLFALGLFDPLGVPSFVRITPQALHWRAYRGAGGAFCWYLPYVPGSVQVSGFRADRDSGTACSFVAHGVGVSVMASTLSQAESDEVIRALQNP